jgi:hypothetical protein
MLDEEPALLAEPASLDAAPKAAAAADDDDPFAMLNAMLDE